MFAMVRIVGSEGGSARSIQLGGASRVFHLELRGENPWSGLLLVVHGYVGVFGGVTYPGEVIVWSLIRRDL